MRTIAAESAATGPLPGIGWMYDLTEESPQVVTTDMAPWQDGYSASPVVDGPAHAGFTCGPALSEPVERMERHAYTTEALLAVTEAVVVPVSADPGPAPSADSVRALIVSPGQCLTLERNTWHGAAMGLRGPCAYYWLAQVDADIESVWTAISDGPVVVTQAGAP